MNPEHYQRVEMVSQQSQDALIQGGLNSGHNPDAAIKAGCETGKRLWSETFPEQQGYGKTTYLDLREACLFGACIFGAFGCFEKADFSQADLRKSKWIGCRATGVNLSGANLQKSTMRAIRCDGWSFRGADLSSATIEIAMCETDSPIDFTDAELTGAQITIMGIARLLMTGAKFANAKVSFTPSPLSPGKDDIQKARELFVSALTEEQKAALKLSKPAASKPWWKFWT